MSYATNVDQYIATFSNVARPALELLRTTILEAAPGVDESIHFSMPAYRMGNSPVAYFAGYKHHVNFFSTPVGFGPVENELAGFHRRRASVRFPYDQPLPIDLIQRIVQYRVLLATTSS